MIRIDGKTFEFLGAPITSSASFGTDDDAATATAKQTGFELTATRSIFSFEADGVEFNVTFLSPVTPNDDIKTSLPFSYLAIDVEPTACDKHSISLYSDIGGEWASGDSAVDIVRLLFRTSAHSPVKLSVSFSHRFGISWLTKELRSILSPAKTNSFSPSTPSRQSGVTRSMRRIRFVFVGTFISCIATDRSLKTRGLGSSGSSSELRTRFIRKGRLDGTFDSKYRRIDDDEPVFGFSAPLSSSEPRVVFTVGHVRHPYVVSCFLTAIHRRD